MTGDVIIFYVNGTKTSQPATFESMAAERVDLSIAGNGLEQSALTVSLNCLTAYVGYKVEISRRLVYSDGTGISGQKFLLHTA